MRPIDETLIDLALDIGYRMGENNQSFKTDSRQAVRKIYELAQKFENWHENTNHDYLAAIDNAADLLYSRMLEEREI